MIKTFYCTLCASEIGGPKFLQ